MGSLKDELRGLREDHKLCEKADDGDLPGGAVPGGPQIGLESNRQGDHKPGLHRDTSYGEENDKNPISKELSRRARGNADRSESIAVQDYTQTASIPLLQQPGATHDDTTVCIKFLNDAGGEIRGETSMDQSADQDKEKQSENDNISVPAPSTPGPSDPRSPAPDGQHHMRTQVSLEVVQCHSAATSPMTPPEGGNPFFFPSAFGRSVGSDTRDAELQVGRQVVLCSVATSPMTPKTPYTTAFPELIGREAVPREERVKRREEQRESGQQGSSTATESSAEVESEITAELTCSASKETGGDLSSKASPASAASRPAASQGALWESHQQCEQQRTASMDQDITITVTHYNNNEEEEGEEGSYLYRTEPDVVQIDECEQLGESVGDMKGQEDGEESITIETVAPAHSQDTSNSNPARNRNEHVSAWDQAQTDVSAMKPPVPESPAPFGCHNIRTQVSLEVVQCQSAATSPMTPPEGDHAFYFPSSYGRCAAAGADTKDAELQVGPQVEFRSVATAPMTPRTPTSTTFPEVRKGAGIEEKIAEEEEGNQEQGAGGKEEEKVPDEKRVSAAAEETNEARNSKEKGEEPVQEVSWDEKGMTWEVYGAVVEVTVLGSAIQKHLEKQVKKRQPSMPPPPPLNPSAMPLTSESVQGKERAGKRRERDGEVSRRRRNPFRLMMENMQQPHCCSKAHTTE